MSKPTQIRSAAQNSHFFNMLIYGMPGIGKTRLLGSSPKAIVLECGTAETDTCAAAGQAVDVWEIHNKTALTEAYEYLRHEGYKDYEWAWIDGLSPLEGRLMREQLDLVHALNPTKRSDIVPDQSDYQIVQRTIDRFVGWFVDLPMNVGFTAHVMIEDTTTFDDDGDEIQTMMMMPQIQGGHGKLSQKICASMNVVGFMDKLDGEEAKTRAMLVHGDSRHLAKDRFDSIGSETGWMLNPTIPKIQAACAKALGKGPKKASVIGKKTAKKSTKATKATKKSAAPAKKAAGLRSK